MPPRCDDVDPRSDYLTAASSCVTLTRSFKTFSCLSALPSCVYVNCPFMCPASVSSQAARLLSDNFVSDYFHAGTQPGVQSPPTRWLELKQSPLDNNPYCRLSSISPRSAQPNFYQLIHSHRRFIQLGVFPSMFIRHSNIQALFHFGFIINHGIPHSHHKHHSTRFRRANAHHFHQQNSPPLAICQTVQNIIAAW